MYDRICIPRTVLIVLSSCWCGRGTMGRLFGVAFLNRDFQKWLRSSLVEGNAVGLYSLLLHYHTIRITPAFTP